MQKKIVSLSIAAMISSSVFAQSVNDGTNPVQVSPDGGVTLLDASFNLVVPGTVTTGTVTGGANSLSLQGSGAGFTTDVTLDGDGLVVRDSDTGQTLDVSWNGTTTVGGDGTAGNIQAGTLNVTNGAGDNTVSLNGSIGAVGAVDISASGTLNVTGATTLTGAFSSSTAGAGLSSSSIAADGSTVSVQQTHAGGNTHGLTVGQSSTTLSGGTDSTTVTLEDGGMTVTDSGFGQTFQVGNSGNVQVGGIGSAGPNGTVSVSNGISNTIVLEGSTGNITAAAGTITGAVVNAGNVNVSGAVTAGNAAIGGNLGVTGTTTMAGTLTANGGINSGTVNINNLASGANNITHVNTVAARQGNFGNTSGTAGVVNIRNGAVDSITLDGAAGQVSAASVAASGLVSAGALQVHTNGGVDVAGAGGLDVSAGGANIGVRNASNTAWNGLSVTDSSASLRGGTASTTLTLDNAGMTVVDTTNGQTLAVSNTGALRVGGNGTVGNKQAGAVNVTNTAGTSTITLNGATGAITATSVTANAHSVATMVASDSITAPNAYLGGAGAEVDLAAGTAVTFNGNRLQGVGAATANTDAVNLNQLNGVRNNLQSQISDNRTEARRGIAGASAIAGIPALESGKQYNFGVGLGHYKGESALALGGNARFDAKTVGRLALGFSGSDATVSAGVGWSF